MNVDLLCVQKILDWVKTQIYLETQVANAKNRFVKRGQVYRCNFGCGVGSEMQKDRPAVIIQNNPSNRTSGNTIVIPVTHDNSSMSCMVPLTPRYNDNGYIILDGQANTSNLICVSKARLGDYICTLHNNDLKEIEKALAKTVSIYKYYNELEHKYNEKTKRIELLKKQRNIAEDELSDIRSQLGISDSVSIIDAIKDLQK